ncbi:MAG TPA: pyruvate kinase [Candidatus Omnitrophota bacterium]|nr:pyruvate kinase [Candidatus Omnitrophota bacterium]HQJ14957.1 pyruvate kinase [Candidatus Omnitrophota bacterium]
MVKTKIVCTLGPASSSETVLRKMMLAGMDVARLNFSHGKQQDQALRIERIRSLNAKYGRRIRILGDLQGHRIRIGSLVDGKPVVLKKRAVVWLTRKPVDGTAREIPFDYPGPLRDIPLGQHIFIDDGTIALQVIGRGRGALKAKVIVEGLLKEHKGVNIPGARLRFNGMSEKDLGDIRFCEEHKVDYIAQSFVRTKKDILEVKKALSSGTQCRVIAKIEDREGIRNIESIIGASDGIMIARGDMGVSLPIYEIPVVQKQIIARCNRAGKPVITATQMLESMTENPRPTRAEVTDVANAILDGTDFVMLSAESAAGKYPVEAVTMMNSIIRFTEKFKSG